MRRLEISYPHPVTYMNDLKVRIFTDELATPTPRSPDPELRNVAKEE